MAAQEQLSINLNSRASTEPECKAGYHAQQTAAYPAIIHGAPNITWPANSGFTAEVFRVPHIDDMLQVPASVCEL